MLPACGPATPKVPWAPIVRSAPPAWSYASALPADSDSGQNATGPFASTLAV